MMIFTFIKKDGDVKRVGAECSMPPELQEACMVWSQNGWVSASAEEFDQQVIHGATRGMIVDPNLVPSGEAKAPEATM